MDQAPNSRRREIIATLSVLIFIVVIVGAVTITNKKKSTVSQASSASAQHKTASVPSTQSTATVASYTDGTYSATGSYDSPGGEESIAVSITLQAGVITDSTVTPKADDPEAKEYQSQFVSGYKQQVVGKKISSVKLSRVSGSSLTSQGFNNAIKQIENQAKV